MPKPLILLYEPIHERALAVLRERAEVRQAASLEEEALVKAVGDVDGIIIRANGKVSRRILEAAPRLKVVARHGVGVEAIDRQAAAERELPLSIRLANDESVAEHCAGMMIALAKRLLEADRAARQRRLKPATG
jgi:D-3-phosphoglycerate dehydrogenase